ncbi:MAG: carbohydrate ABC transporter substrate-binding protein, partial [Ruminococcus sp.]|nr:carbohydrate ABC transporter substrate-binding protein [Ruminococcus sp.]
MKTRKIVSAVLAAVMSLTALGAFVGCGSEDSSTAGGSAASGESKSEGGTLEVLTNRTDRVNDGSYAEMTKAFEEANNCKVNYVAYEDYAGSVSTRMGTDDYGDVLCIPDDVALADLKNFFEPFGTYDEISAKYRWADAKMDADKNVYGISTGGNAVGILYNKKVWSDAGISEMPKTPDEFIADLKQIGEKTDAIPLYTEYAAADWTLNQWGNLVISATGNANYENDILNNKLDLFAKDGGYYQVYKLMFDIFSTPEILEEDHANTDWESSKVWFGEGKIATLVMGSWAISQFQENAGDNVADIGYMPAPFTAADGKQYAETSSDFCLGVSKNSKNVELAKKYVEWFVNDSGYAQKEGLIGAALGSQMPDNLSAFQNVETFSKNSAPDELIGKWDEVDKESGVGIWDGSNDNFKLKMAEAAFAGKGESEFDAIIKEANDKWAAARDKVL